MDSIISKVRAEAEAKGGSSVSDALDKEIGEARIVVVGCGGAGNNTINRLAQLGIKGAQLIAINTDKQHLTQISADKKVLIGYEITRGLGAGGDPAKGEAAAIEAKPALKEILEGVDLAFVTGGLGGGTGSGSLPVVAEVAKDAGAVVVGAVTMPFKIEGARIPKAKEALSKLREHADSVVVIDNNKLLGFVPDLPINDAFLVADEVLSRMVKGITETIYLPSLVNLDFADVRAVMQDGSKHGIAMIGLGESDTRNRAEEAVMHALQNPLLDVDYHGATGALVHITGGEDLTLAEATKIGEVVSAYLTEDSNVVWGARIDPEFNGMVQVMVIMTGVHSPDIMGPRRSTTEIQIPRRRGGFSSYRRHSTSQPIEREVPAMMANLGIDYIL